MGWFAYGHPFLDGNGRTMLIIHSELCHRADFCIEWQRTRKTDYLTALSAEISSPGKGHLDRYLNLFVGTSRARDLWGRPPMSGWLSPYFLWR
jgi:cell filamentation protein